MVEMCGKIKGTGTVDEVKSRWGRGVPVLLLGTY